MAQYQALAIGRYLPAVVFRQTVGKNRLTAVINRNSYDLSLAIVARTIHEQVVAARVELERRRARADNLVAVKVSDEPCRYRLAPILRIDVAFYGVAAIVGEARAPQLCAVEHVFDRVKTLGTRLENIQSRIVVCAQRHLRLHGATAFEQGADDEVVGTRLKRNVFPVSLCAIYIDLVCFQTADGKRGLRVGGRLSIEGQ